MKHKNIPILSNFQSETCLEVLKIYRRSIIITIITVSSLFYIQYLNSGALSSHISLACKKYQGHFFLCLMFLLSVLTFSYLFFLTSPNLMLSYLISCSSLTNIGDTIFHVTHLVIFLLSVVISLYLFISTL